MRTSWNFVTTLYLAIGVAFECGVYGVGNYAFGIIPTLLHIFLWPLFSVWVFWPFVMVSVFVFWAVMIIRQIDFSLWKELAIDLYKFYKE